MSLYKGGVGIHFKNLLWERPIRAFMWLCQRCYLDTYYYTERSLPELRTILGRGTQYDWQIKELSDGSMSNDIVPVESWVKVAGQVIQTNLQVKNK
jgi:hypothetical protein